MANKFCPECGADNPNVALFCMECGKKFACLPISEFKCELKQIIQIKKLRKNDYKLSKRNGKIFLFKDKFVFTDEKDTIEINWSNVIEILYYNSANQTKIRTTNKQTFIVKGKIENLEVNSTTDEECINKMKNYPQYFTVDVLEVIEETPKKIKDNSGKMAAATLLGGVLLGPVGALTGYAATRGSKVIQNPEIIKREVKRSISFYVSVHQKGIKMINNTNTQFDNVIKIPWDQIIDSNYTELSIHSTALTIKSLNNEDITLKGDREALKGLYLITKDRMSGFEEKEKGWE